MNAFKFRKSKVTLGVLILLSMNILRAGLPHSQAQIERCEEAGKGSVGQAEVQVHPAEVFLLRRYQKAGRIRKTRSILHLRN